MPQKLCSALPTTRPSPSPPLPLPSPPPPFPSPSPPLPLPSPPPPFPSPSLPLSLPFPPPPFPSPSLPLPLSSRDENGLIQFICQISLYKKASSWTLSYSLVNGRFLLWALSTFLLTTEGNEREIW